MMKITFPNPPKKNFIYPIDISSFSVYINEEENLDLGKIIYLIYLLFILFIGSKNIGDEGAKAITEALKINQTLLILNLGKIIYFVIFIIYIIYWA